MLFNKQVKVRTNFLVELPFHMPMTKQVAGKATEKGHVAPHEVALMAQLMAAEMRCQFANSVSIWRRPAVVSV